MIVSFQKSESCSIQVQSLRLVLRVLVFRFKVLALDLCLKFCSSGSKSWP